MAHIDKAQLSSNTVEGLFFELATILQKLESTSAWNPDNKNLVNIQINTDTGVAQVTANVVVENKVGVAGNSIFIAKPYLKNDKYPAPQPVPNEFFVHQQPG